MFGNKKRLGYPNQYIMPMPEFPDMSFNYDVNRLLTEIEENKRIINELIKRVNRLETYLGIRDGNDHLF